MKPLSDDEKKALVELFMKLRNAIRAGGSEAGPLSIQFQHAYRGDSRSIVDAYTSATDKIQWAGQVEVHLKGEIEPRFWPPDA